MKNYRSARIYDAGGDLSQRWFVYYYFRDPGTGRWKRFREYGSINRMKTQKDRIREANCLLDAVNGLLFSGWNPFEQNQDIVVRNVNRFTIRERVEYAMSLKQATARHRTYQTYRTAADAFLKWCEHSKLDQSPMEMFGRHQARRYADELVICGGIGNRTRNNRITCLKAIFGELVEREILPANPWAAVKPLKTDSGRNIAFTQKQQTELRNLIRENDPGLFLFVQIMYFCFIRPKELCALRVIDVDLQNRRIRIPGSVSKNRKAQMVVIPDALVASPDFLERIENIPGEYFLFSRGLYPGQSPIHRNRVTERHKVFLRKLGLGGEYSLYSWKHTGVVRAFEAGIHIKDLQAQLRHHSLEMVNVYLKSLGMEPSSHLRTVFPEF